MKYMGTDLPVMTAIKFWLRIESHVMFTAFSIVISLRNRNSVRVLQANESKDKGYSFHSVVLFRLDSYLEFTF
jgi:hypothetical protein